MPVLQYVDQLLPTPDKLLIGLAAGLVIPLLAWWTRYWFVTALAGHITFAALVVITFPCFRRGNLCALHRWICRKSWRRFGPGSLDMRSSALSLFVLVMCIADHVAFVRYLATLRQHFARKK